MVNSDEFSKRIQDVMAYYELNASSFADRIQVGRASISHLLTGRNKPSLDFVLKVINEFEEVELYWLLNGKGSFPKSDLSSTPTTNKRKEASLPQDTSAENQPVQKTEQTNSKQNFGSLLNSSSKSIKNLIICYNDGTFDVLTPNK